jgi:hypothetical protein
MNIHPLGAQLILADRWAHGQTDMIELLAFFATTRMHVQRSLQSVGSKKNIQGRMSFAFVIKHGILQLVTWGLKCLSLLMNAFQL